MKPRSKWPNSNWARPDMTPDQAIRFASALGLERLDAQLLLLHALGRTATERAWLLAHGSDVLTPEVQTAFEGLARRRRAGEPVAYITGTKAFYGLDLLVDPRVLDPRADTETLVEWALELLPLDSRCSAVDLGTGSGAIALALQSHRPLCEVHALDFSPDALAVARANAQRLQLPVRFVQGSWLDGVQGRFDVIVSNPPYIAADDPHLAALAFEPSPALAAGADGLDDLRKITAQASAHLKPGGWLLLEHGYRQAAAVRELLQRRGFVDVQSRKDLAGIERCSGACWRDNF